jgi:magnesium-transporting ATPase (P-type)
MHLDRLVRQLWHATPAEAAFAHLEASAAGLTSAEAAARRILFGPNVLPRPRRPGPFRVYLRQFKSPLIYVLLAAAAVSLLIGEYSDALFIFAVLQINAVIGTAQELKAEGSAEALDRMVVSVVTARRDGATRRLDSRDLVPGDVVLLESGGRVPADIRLIRAHELKVDESLLTGESVPVEKSPAAALPEPALLAERSNMLHAGSTVVSGRAEGVVVLTGRHTEIGRIADALVFTPSPPPPLVVRLERFSRYIGGAVVVACAALALVLVLRGAGLLDIFFVAVALAVSAIPEGLPVAITVALSVATARMARRNVIVRALPAVEGLGACTVIASDKTGTLTCNQLTVTALALPGLGRLQVTGEGYAPVGRLERDGTEPTVAETAAARRLAAAAALCNEAQLYAGPDGVRHVGDTVDVAFLALAGKLGLDWTAPAGEARRTDLIPFEAERRYGASFHLHDGRPRVWVKGAAEVVVPMCRDVDAAAVLAEAEAMAADGFRVIAVAEGEGAAARVPLGGLRFLGLAGLIDPVRPEVPGAVARCRRAGVEVRMVTGDHPATAAAIARRLGLEADREQALTGAQLADLAVDPAETDLAVAEAPVFARVEPVQKLQIVQSLQRQGHFVAVTGDGVNDAPALRTAHIGVAMGKDGTDVARGAADLILADDNFASIVAGIEEGRIAYDNVRKVIYLLVSTGGAEIALFAFAVAFGLPLPLFAVQLLWLNLVTNGIQHVALAFERGEPDILDRPPRPPSQPIFDRRMIEQTLLSGLYMGGAAFLFYWWALRAGWAENEVRNAVLLLMVLFENVHVFNCRSETRSLGRMPFLGNPLVILVVPAAQLVHIGAMYVPGLNELLGIAPIDFATWARVALIALSLVAVMEGYKAVRFGTLRRSRPGA